MTSHDAIFGPHTILDGLADREAKPQECGLEDFGGYRPSVSRTNRRRR